MRSASAGGERPAQRARSKKHDNFLDHPDKPPAPLPPGKEHRALQDRYSFLMTHATTGPGSEDFRPPKGFIEFVCRNSAPPGKKSVFPHSSTFLAGGPDTDFPGFDHLPAIWPIVFHLGYTAHNLFRIHPDVLVDPPTISRDHAAPIMAEVYHNIEALTPGGIRWIREMPDETVDLARFVFIHQFAHYIDLYHPGMITRVRDMKMSYPQIYYCVCHWCGEDVLYDFWGLPVRGFDGQGRKILSNHRCNYKSGPYFAAASGRYTEGHIPTPTQRRDVCTVMSQVQIVAARLIVYFALHVWARTSRISGQPDDEPQMITGPLRYQWTNTEYAEQVHNRFHLNLFNTERLVFRPFFALPRLGRAPEDIQSRYDVVSDMWPDLVRQWHDGVGPRRARLHTAPLLPEDSAELHHLPRPDRAQPEVKDPQPAQVPAARAVGDDAPQQEKQQDLKVDEPRGEGAGAVPDRHVAGEAVC